MRKDPLNRLIAPAWRNLTSSDLIHAITVTRGHNRLDFPTPSVNTTASIPSINTNVPNLPVSTNVPISSVISNPSIDSITNDPTLWDVD